MFEIRATELPAFDTSVLKTVIFETSDDHVATITLNRADRLNSFNQATLDDFQALWAHIRANDTIHAVVIRGGGERAFSTGVDVKDGYDRPTNVWVEDDPGIHLGPKANHVWKPVVCAVHGMAAGGAFYWINESDVVICSDDATFFEPHVSYGMVAALEPIGLARRIPLGEVLRMALLGVDERMSAARALQIGLVTEVVPTSSLHARAHELAARIAAKPPAAVQGTVRAIWESLDETRRQALERGLAYTLIGNPIGVATVERGSVERPAPFIR